MKYIIFIKLFRYELLMICLIKERMNNSSRKLCALFRMLLSETSEDLTLLYGLNYMPVDVK